MRSRDPVSNPLYSNIYALREYVFWGVAGPPFLQLSSILPMDCIQIFALCVAAGFMFE